MDWNTRGQHRSACNSFFWNTFSWNTVQQDLINFLPLKVSVREIACVNGDVRLCRPTATILCESTSPTREYAKSLRCLDVSATNQSTLALCRNKNIVPIPSQMCVFVDFYPLHGIDLATCISELTHFFICQNNTCIEVHPRFPFGVSRLSEGSLHVGWTRWEVTALFFNSFFLLLWRIPTILT